MAEFRLSRTAQRELDQIFDFAVTQWNLSQALRYTDMLQASCVTVVEASNKGKDCAHIRSGYRGLRDEQHVIYFRTAAYGVAGCAYCISAWMPPYSVNKMRDGQALSCDND